MVPGRYDIIIYRGSTWTIGLGHKNDQGVATDFDAAYINVPTAGLGTVRMHIRPAWKNRPEDTKVKPLLELTIANSRIIVVTELITLLLSAAVTADLDFNEGSYDIELVTGDTEPVVDKLLYGQVAVKDEKTA